MAHCTNPDHDHYGQIEAAKNGTGPDTGNDRLVCGDCLKPMHYDSTVEDYRHDAGTQPCWMIRYPEPATACTFPAETLTLGEMDIADVVSIRDALAVAPAPNALLLSYIEFRLARHAYDTTRPEVAQCRA